MASFVALLSLFIGVAFTKVESIIESYFFTHLSTSFRILSFSTLSILLKSLFISFSRYSANSSPFFHFPKLES